MCENARIFQLTAVETLQQSLPRKQPQLFATVTSFRGNNAICRPHTDAVAAATILQCLLWREQSKQPVYFCCFLSILPADLWHEHTHTHMQAIGMSLSARNIEENSPTLVLIFSAVSEEYDSFAMQLDDAGYTAYTGYTHVQLAST